VIPSLSSFLRRDGDLGWKTPAYQISGSSGQDFIFAISGDENDELIDKISFAHDTQDPKTSTTVRTWVLICDRRMTKADTRLHPRTTILTTA
jgi:hypothetical protein